MLFEFHCKVVVKYFICLNSTTLPVTTGESRVAPVTVTSLDQSSIAKTPDEDLDSEKASATCSSVTDLSAEKVAAKMIERKIKVKCSCLIIT